MKCEECGTKLTYIDEYTGWACLHVKCNEYKQEVYN